jgi:hypothetical protein
VFRLKSVHNDYLDVVVICDQVSDFVEIISRGSNVEIQEPYEVLVCLRDHRRKTDCAKEFESVVEPCAIGRGHRLDVSFVMAEPHEVPGEDDMLEFGFNGHFAARLAGLDPVINHLRLSSRLIMD